jgi:hypothetical protein
MARSKHVVPMSRFEKSWDRPLGHAAIVRRPNVPMSHCPVVIPRACVRDACVCDAWAHRRERARVHESFFSLGHWDIRTSKGESR